MFFKTISPEIRMNIIGILREGPMSVTEICKSLKEEQSKISHNLKKLTECNFLTVKKDGKKRLYSLNEDTLLPLLKLVEKHVKTHCEGTCNKHVEK